MNSLWIGLIIVALVTVFAAGKVIAYMRESERQWQQVDKSKLKKWDDEND